MADLDLSVTITRDLLGLTPLEINDHVDYYLGPNSFGAQVDWTRDQQTSRWHDGAVTTNRVLNMVEEPVQVEVIADSNSELRALMGTLLKAFCQDSFIVTITVEDAVYTYLAEAAGYQYLFQGPRFLATQGQMVFTMPRQPNALDGVI